MPTAKNSKGIRNALFEIISLSNTKYRFFTFVAILFALWLAPLAALDAYLPQLSVCHWVLGRWCYSVGITRGVSSLLKGRLSDAIQYNPLSIPVLVVMAGIVIYDGYGIMSRKR